MERLTEIVTGWKIPVVRTAKQGFDWLKAHASPVFDVLAAAMEGLISGILWLLSSPHPFVVVAAAVALTWALQRRLSTCLLVAAGFLFILNQGYWDETMQ